VLAGGKNHMGEERNRLLFAKYPQEDVNGIQTAVVHFDDAVYFVPRYAMHRPVARKILRKSYVSPPLHSLVERVMEWRPGSMLHAGTFFGDMLPSFSRKTPGLVYAFEPVLENYLLARHVTERNELDNVLLFHAALADCTRQGQVETMKSSTQHRGGASFVVSNPERRTHATQRVSLIPVDHLAIDDLSMLQLDVERFERYVLEGALETIARNEPVIVLEDNLDDCEELLSTLGYTRSGQVAGDHLYLTPAGQEALPEFTGAPVR
jgi:FkbM family methyltransferase